MKIVKNYIKGKNRPGLKMNPQYVVIHNTRNKHKNAGAKMHRDYAEGNSRGASYHWAVDEDYAYAIIPENENAWHAGDGYNGKGNRKGIAIEMCENGNYEKTFKNTANLAAQRLKSHGLNISALKRHKDFSGKYCPAWIMEHGDWNRFINTVKSYLNKDKGYLIKGDRGEKVRLLQEDLIKLGYAQIMKPYGADSNYGAATRKAVLQFQKDNNLQIDGIAGKETQNKINQLMKPKDWNRVVVNGKQVAAYLEVEGALERYEKEVEKSKNKSKPDKVEIYYIGE